MVALPSVPGVVKFTVEGDVGGIGWVNVIHYAYTGTVPTGGTLVSFCSTLLTTWGTQFSPLMSVAGSVTRATAVDLSSTSGAGGEATDTLPGVRTGATLPPSSAVLVSKHIARRYRGGHPRSYIVAGTVTDLDDPGHWTTALTVAVDGAYSAVLTAMNALVVGGTDLTGEAIVSYFDTTLIPAPPHRRITPLVEPVTGISVRTAIASQRRRLR